MGARTAADRSYVLQFPVVTCCNLQAIPITFHSVPWPSLAISKGPRHTHHTLTTRSRSPHIHRTLSSAFITAAAWGICSAQASKTRCPSPRRWSSWDTWKTWLDELAGPRAAPGGHASDGWSGSWGKRETNVGFSKIPCRMGYMWIYIYLLKDVGVATSWVARLGLSCLEVLMFRSPKSLGLLWPLTLVFIQMPCHHQLSRTPPQETIGHARPQKGDLPFQETPECPSLRFPECPRPRNPSGLVP